MWRIIVPEDGLGDWRKRYIARLAEDYVGPSGRKHEKGTPARLTTLTKDNSGNTISFTTPSAPALLMEVSINGAKEAKLKKEQLRFEEGGTHNKEIKHVIKPENLYDYFQNAMISAVFAFQSIEVFCNDIIANNVDGSYKIKREGEQKTYSPWKLQRYCSTPEKVATILPDLLSTDSPKGLVVWEKFTKLKEARDKTVHMKGEDAYTGGNIDKKTFFYTLIKSDPGDFPKYAFNTISFFYGNDYSRWLKGAEEEIEGKLNSN